MTQPEFVTSKTNRGGRRYLPFAFTEQGVAMLSSVLGSERAIAVNIEIMRAFVRMRQLLGANRSRPALCTTRGSHRRKTRRARWGHHRHPVGDTRTDELAATQAQACWFHRQPQ
jgi:hypothetical protein